MNRVSALLSACLCLTITGCTRGPAGATDPTGLGKADSAESDPEGHAQEWAELSAYFQGGDDRGGIWYLGDGNDLGEGDDYCSLAYAEEQASDPWAINSSFGVRPVSVADYLIYHAASDLASARASYNELPNDGEERAELESNVERLRRFLIRAVLRADAIEMYSEGDRFGGYRCIEISTPDGSYLIASGGWS